MYSDHFDAISDKDYQHLLSYLITLTEEERTALLYDYLMNEKSGVFTKIIYRLIKELMVFDGKKLEQCLQDKNEENRIKALQIVVADKPFFTKEDIPEYEILINLISQNFPKTAKTGTTKMFLSSKEVEVWICECGNKNDSSKEYCENINCGKDPYGFKKDQISPLFALKRLKENIHIIKTNVVN